MTQATIPKELLFPGWEQVAKDYLVSRGYNWANGVGECEILGRLRLNWLPIPSELLLALYEAHPHKASKM